MYKKILKWFKSVYWRKEKTRNKKVNKEFKTWKDELEEFEEAEEEKILTIQDY